MTLKRCCANDCATSAHLHPDVPLYKFPRDLDRCQTWVRNAGNDKLLQAPSRKLSVRRYLCANHFEENQFFDKFRRRLRRTAVPTLFSCTPLSEEIMRKFPVHDYGNSEGSYSQVERPSCSTLNSLCNQYKTFPFPSVNGSVYSSHLLIDQEEEESATNSSSLKILNSTSAKDLNSNVPGSITYIEGPWSQTMKDDESMPIQIIDSLTKEKEHQESGTDMEEVIKNFNLELPNQQLFDNSENERPAINYPLEDISEAPDCLELPSKLPLHPLLLKSVSFTEDAQLNGASELSEQNSSDTDSLLFLPTQDRHYFLQNKQLSSGAEVRVMYSMPQAAIPYAVQL